MKNILLLCGSESGYPFKTEADYFFGETLLAFAHNDPYIHRFASDSYAASQHSVKDLDAIFLDFPSLQKKLEGYRDDYFDVIIQAAHFPDTHQKEQYIPAEDLFRTVFEYIAQNHLSMDDCTMEELLGHAREAIANSAFETNAETPEFMDKDLIGYTRTKYNIFEFLEKRFPKATKIGTYVEAKKNIDLQNELISRLRSYAERFHLDVVLYINIQDSIPVLGSFFMGDCSLKLQKGKLPELQRHLKTEISLYL